MKRRTRKVATITLPAELVEEFRRRRKNDGMTPAGFMRVLLELDSQRRCAERSAQPDENERKTY